MKKTIIITLFFLVSFFSFSQNDTIHVNFPLDQIWYANYSQSEGIFIINDSIVDGTTFHSFVSKHEEIMGILMRGMMSQKYFKFYNLNGTISEEGKWRREFWDGPYKKYHPNGKIAAEGSYEPYLGNSLLWGKKIGIWKYYTTQGNLYRKEKYNTMGELVNIWQK